VGRNLEDATHEPGRALFAAQEQIERIREARKAAEAHGIPLGINARTDVFLLSDDRRGSRSPRQSGGGTRTARRAPTASSRRASRMRSGSKLWRGPYELR